MPKLAGWAATVSVHRSSAVTNVTRQEAPTQCFVRRRENLTRTCKPLTSAPVQVLNSVLQKPIATLIIRYISPPAFFAPMVVHFSHGHITVYVILFALGLYMAVAAVETAPELPVRGRLSMLMAGIAAALIAMLLFWTGCINCAYLRGIRRAFQQRTDTVRQRALLCSNTCVSACP